MSKTIQKERLDAIRKIMARESLDAFILSNGDRYFSEYPPEHEKLIEWLCGFTGSAGTVVIMAQKAAFFTDGRYTLQAAQELDSSLYTVHNQRDVQPLAWLRQQQEDACLGYDSWRVSIAQLRRWQKAHATLRFQAITENPIIDLWQHRPNPCADPAYVYPDLYAGKSREEKISDCCIALRDHEIEAVLLSQPESVNWLLNIRGNDIEHTPVFLCNALVYADGNVTVYADTAKFPDELCDGLTVKAENALISDISALRSLWLQADVTPAALQQAIQQSGLRVLEKQDPCTLPKAVKNRIELRHIRDTHLIDGLALTRFLHWIDTTDLTELSELRASDALTAFRAEHSGFKQPSFPTISGVAANGAIVHYRVTPQSDQRFQADTLYLVDSGGQYLGGTTDVTRTIAIGTPSQEMIDAYTRVLKGHIALGSAIFPRETKGAALDVLARHSLWQAGLDYDHGTGHGVGCYLGVHEGPQGISKYYRDVALQAGMILSNEPGYYKNGEYGIRIENLVEVIPAAHDGFFCFKDLTCAPMDRRLVDVSMLTRSEIEWWNRYHAWVLDAHSARLTDKERQWLERACAALPTH